MSSENGTPEDPWQLLTPPWKPPLLEHLGLVQLEHFPRNNRIRAAR